MAKKRLTGRNGKIYFASKSAVTTGDGTTALTKGSFYVPVTIASSSSGFPAKAQVGVVLVGDGTSQPTSSEKYIALTLSSQCDITSAEVEFEKGEIDVTTLCDDIKKYAAGMTDASGTLEGITTLDLSEPMIAKFVTVQSQAADGTITVTNQNDDALVLALEVNKENATDTAPRAIFFSPVVLNGYTLQVQIDESQTFSSGFRVAQDADIKPAFIEADQSLFTAGA